MYGRYIQHGSGFAELVIISITLLYSVSLCIQYCVKNPDAEETPPRSLMVVRRLLEGADWHPNKYMLIHHA